MKDSNQTVTRDMAKIGDQQAEGRGDRRAHPERDMLIDAPGLKSRAPEVFDCAMGERSNLVDGPRADDGGDPAFISGAISQTVNIRVGDRRESEKAYFEGGSSAQGCSRLPQQLQGGQPPSASNDSKKAASCRGPAVRNGAASGPQERLRRFARAQTVSFSRRGRRGPNDGGGAYPDDGLGEVLHQDVRSRGHATLASGAFSHRGVHGLQ